MAKPVPDACQGCENYLPEGGKRRWTFHEVVPPLVMLASFIGGGVWFFSGQSTAQADMDKRLATVEHFKDDTGSKITEILVRLMRIETLIEKKLP